ncbi:MAG: DUF927 domain-containing protein [Gammaproteobacteria bacterium]|nr:DUF927 domain-containing protein [Gammaproteobacteria bacterium]
MAHTETIVEIPGAVLWKKILPHIPRNYQINENGVYFTREIRGDAHKEFIAGPCWVTALTRTNQGLEWGYLVYWIDQDDNLCNMAFPARRLSEPRLPVIGDLRSQGLKIVPGKERQLMTYIGSYNLPTDFRLQAAPLIGWTETKRGDPVFVLPNRAISLSPNEEIIFQPEAYSPTVRTMHSSGNLAQWQTFVAKPCRDNPILVFSLCAALAGPLLKFAGLDSGGFHLWGASSKGKTTTLQAGASVWGNGSDPAVSEDSFIGRWNTTGNAIEAIAAAHNHVLLALDEIGTCDAKNFGKVIYDLFGGRGKSRLQDNSALRPERVWKILGLSSGEISIRQKIEEETGRRVMVGHIVRFVDIEIAASGVVAVSHGYQNEPGKFVDRFKENCGKYYGTAGPEFIDKLVNMEPDAVSLTQRIKTEIDYWELNLTNQKNFESWQQRVIRRFALVAAAGSLAVKFGILNYPLTEIEKMIVCIRDAWLADNKNKPSGAIGVDAIREFILRNPGSFPRENDERTNSKDLAGYRVGNGEKYGLYLFTMESFSKVCAGLSVKAVLDELDLQGFLHTNEKDRKSTRHSIPNLGRPRFYAIRQSILNDNDEDGP